jgi:hypothetical protein
VIARPEPARCSTARSIFVYAVAKNMRDNISDAELADLKDLAALFLGYSGKEIDRAVARRESSLK